MGLAGTIAVSSGVSLCNGTSAEDAAKLQEKVAARDTSFHSMEAKRYDGTTIPLSKYAGRAVLIVNIGSSGNFDRYYASLKTWLNTYPYLEIVLWPSDDFGGEAALPDEEMAALVESKGLRTKGPGCTLMRKVKVNGDEADPVWQLARAAYPGLVKNHFQGLVLFDKLGRPIGRFKWANMSNIKEAISEAVKAKPEPTKPAKGRGWLSWLGLR